MADAQQENEPKARCRSGTSISGHCLSVLETEARSLSLLRESPSAIEPQDQKLPVSLRVAKGLLGSLSACP